MQNELKMPQFVDQNLNLNENNKTMNLGFVKQGKFSRRNRNLNKYRASTQLKSRGSNLSNISNLQSVNNVRRSMMNFENANQLTQKSFLLDMSKSNQIFKQAISPFQQPSTNF